MPLTLKYRSTRAEVWRWYWREWRRPHGLWRYHLLLLVGLPSLALLAPVLLGVHAGVWPALTFAITACIFLALYPMIRFKPQERTLVIGPDGLSTTIGRKRGQRAWSVICEVTPADGGVVMKTSKSNAFIIPARAFAEPREVEDLLQRVAVWRAQATG